MDEHIFPRIQLVSSEGGGGSSGFVPDDILSLVICSDKCLQALSFRFVQKHTSTPWDC